MQIRKIRWEHKSDWYEGSERMVPAIVLIAVGALFFLNNLHILPIRDILRILGPVFSWQSASNAGRGFHRNRPGEPIGGAFVGVERAAVGSQPRIH